MRYLTTCWIIILSSLFILQAQKSPERFGKIEDSDVLADDCPIDSNAQAYYIFDVGSSYFQYADVKQTSTDHSSERKGFQIYFNRHYRIKILNEASIAEHADIKIPLYHSINGEEEITQIKAVTYNFENGKVEKYKLDKGNIIKEEKNKYWNIVKFPMPNVKAGSVIEVEYTIRTDFVFNLREWQFQHSIPALYSEYYVSIPEYFYYNQTQRGYYPISTETDQKSNSVTITYEEKSQGLSSGYKYTDKIDYLETTYRYTSQNVPAFPLEKFLRTPDNYLTKISFELSSTRFPRSPVRSYTTSWEEINKDLNKDDDFGLALKQSGFLKDLALGLKGTGTIDENLLILAFESFKKKMIWNNYYSLYVKSSLRQAFKDGNGNSAEVNLCLTALMRELGFEAYPVLVSTREHGIIHPAHPSLTSFNHVISLVRLNNEDYLMDATDPWSEVNVLPVRCLNDQGRVANEGGGFWIDLLNGNKAQKQVVLEASFDENMNLTGSVDYALKNYSAYNKRSSIKSFATQDEYIKNIEEEYTGLKLTETEILNLDSLYKPIKEKHKFSYSDYVESAGDLLYFSPLLFEKQESNPFKLEKREYPVEMPYPSSELISTSIELPVGYEIESLPQPVMASTPDKSCKFMFSINQLGNKLQVNSMVSINKVMFTPEEYEVIKGFFALMVDKQNEQVVLKKKL